MAWPPVLMLSGVGEAAQLQEHGIEVKKDLAGVGKNMQDHLQARLVYKCNEPTLNDEVGSLFGQAKIALKYAMTRTGPMTMAASLATGFMKTREDLETPDIQFHVQPLSAENPGKGADKFSAFTMSVCQLRPESRGENRLNSADGQVYPKIIPNYLSTETDCNATLDWARNNTASIYHPTGTCKMGSGMDAVVDHKLRVHGVSGLRVADCSIMPEIVSGNTNAPAIMIGENCAKIILADA